MATASYHDGLSQAKPARRAARKTQRQRILDALLAAKGQPVPAYQLGRIALQYCARLKELRDLGFRITSHEETPGPNGERHTSFSLDLGIPGASERPTAPTPAADYFEQTESLARAKAMPLFEARP